MNHRQRAVLRTAIELTASVEAVAAATPPKLDDVMTNIHLASKLVETVRALTEEDKEGL